LETAARGDRRLGVATWVTELHGAKALADSA
jgi:hypothetical protein